MHKENWLGFIPDIEAGYAPWLHDHGSLTKRIQQRCNKFHVRNIFDGLAMSFRDEITALNIPRQQKIYTREVFLYADDQAVIFAHSVVAAHHLHGVWHTLQHLGSKPLGALLFFHPLVKRAPLHFRALKADHPLYRHAAQTLENLPPRLWARRSVFTLHGAPLLVTEVFLPNILKLKNCPLA